MADEIPRYLGTAQRVAPAAVSGSPIPRVLQLQTRIASAAINGAPHSQTLNPIVSQQVLPYTGPSQGRGCRVEISRRGEFWGWGRIAGKITLEGTPASRRVRLFDSLTGLLVDQVWSDTEGRYAFDFLDTRREYFVLSHDYVRQFNAVVADWIVPEPYEYP